MKFFISIEKLIVQGVFVITTFVSSQAIAQISQPYTYKNTKANQINHYLSIARDSTVRSNFLPGGSIKFYLLNKQALQNIRPSFAYDAMGWFCKQEWKFQQQTKIPLFIRLGSKVQTDYLEGKFR